MGHSSSLHTEEPQAPPEVALQPSALVEEDMLPLDMPLLPPPVCDWNEKKPQASVLGKYLREAALRGDLRASK
jgi:hypothetical protein